MDPQARTHDKHWLPWTKRELEKRGIKTEIPLMPSPWAPVYADYKRKFDQIPVDDNTILIGTSCGCSFLVRWLGDTKRRVRKLIMVAPWKIGDQASAFEKAFYEFPIDSGIKDRVKEIIMFTADNEKRDGKRGLQVFHDALGGEVISIPGYGHYIMDHMKTEEFPELIEAVMK